MQYIFLDAHYDKPFFLTYYSTSLFSLYLLGFISKKWRNLNNDTYQKLQEDTQQEEEQQEREEETVKKLPIIEVFNINSMVITHR